MQQTVFRVLGHIASEEGVDQLNRLIYLNSVVSIAMPDLLFPNATGRIVSGCNWVLGSDHTHYEKR